MHYVESEVARLAQCLAEPWSGYVRSLGTVAAGAGFTAKDAAEAAIALTRLRLALLNVHFVVNQWEDDDE